MHTHVQFVYKLHTNSNIDIYIYEHARNLISWQKPHCTITERCEWSYYNCIAFYFQNNHQKNDDSNADVLASKFQIFYALYWYSWLAFICTDLKHKTAHIVSKIFGFMCATGLVWFINLSTESFQFFELVCQSGKFCYCVFFSTLVIFSISWVVVLHYIFNSSLLGFWIEFYRKWTWQQLIMEFLKTWTKTRKFIQQYWNIVVEPW